jgi:hypothetical protein
VPTVLFVTSIFTKLAQAEARFRGLPDARIVTMAHPLGGNSPEEIRQKADLAVPAMLPLVGAAA